MNGHVVDGTLLEHEGNVLNVQILVWVKGNLLQDSEITGVKKAKRGNNEGSPHDNVKGGAR